MIYSKHTTKKIANALLVVSLLSTSVMFATEEVVEDEVKRTQEVTCSVDGIPPRL